MKDTSVFFGFIAAGLVGGYLLAHVFAGVSVIMDNYIDNNRTPAWTRNY
jgi:hypothetical protein